ncbi:ATP-binding protein [Helicobacter equorum]|uniref:Histidine kinase/HSP90-like ATPase domain-containing protein n=1 Tax=Helicobacter equorum TaxID=361872 RepID=A0A3D8IUB2_9HELI|nr:ATP-binding protein [Helicobacter equorum]RDU68505.1 hypothetical protein CQA54_01480 [Helicobacter equorum]
MMNSFAEIKSLAARFYKNKQNGIELTLRECISNSIHACIIKSKNTTHYFPKIEIVISGSQNSITIKDNGIGFSEQDKQVFCALAMQNKLKIDHNLPTKGLGRLAIVHFSIEALYETSNQGKRLSFTYPQENIQNLFEQSAECSKSEDGTTLYLKFPKNTFKTFANKYKDLEKFKKWFMDNFIFLSNDIKIEISINIDNIDNKIFSLDTENIEKFDRAITIDNKSFNCNFYLIKSTKLEIKLVAHKLLTNRNIDYDRDFKENNKKIYLSSELLDERITADGLDIEICDIRNILTQEITKILDEYFKETIESQKKQSEKNLEQTKGELPFLGDFMPTYSSLNGFKIETREDFIDKAIKDKGEAEKQFWCSQNNDQLDERLQKSSLYLHVKHRERVLNRLEEMMSNPQYSENDFHQLLTDRKCKDLKVANHNLWLLDDKFSYFIEAYSAKHGEKKVDLELYFNPFIDEENSPKQVVLVELKRLTRAHNPGEMIEQLLKYASDIYKESKTKKGTKFDPEKCKFFGYIIADYKDIKKEEGQQDSYIFKPIPFTNSSFEGIKSFQTDNGRIDIAITLLSIQDLITVSKSRNKIFLDMLSQPNP